MNSSNQSCPEHEDLQKHQYYVYLVVYSVILGPGLLANVLAIWVFSSHVKETKKAIVFMMNLAVADLLQVLSLPLRIYYYLTYRWPFGQAICKIIFYLKYVNMYTSIFFLCCISVRRCQLVRHPLTFNPRWRAELLISGLGWLGICIACLGFPMLRNFPLVLPTSEVPTQIPKCFSEMSLRAVSPVLVTVVLVAAELLGFVLPLLVVLVSTCMTAASLRELSPGAVRDRGEKKRAMTMVLICATVFLVCFAPYHITMALHFLVKANLLTDCGLRDQIQRWHPVALCLASLNSILDPIIYYFTTHKFWRQLIRPGSAVRPEVISSSHGRSWYMEKRKSRTRGEPSF